MQKFEITQEQIQILVNYLKTRPYEEVYMGIQFLMNLPKVGSSIPEEELNRNLEDTSKYSDLPQTEMVKSPEATK